MAAATVAETAAEMVAVLRAAVVMVAERAADREAATAEGMAAAAREVA